MGESEGGVTKREGEREREREKEKEELGEGKLCKRERK